MNIFQYAVSGLPKVTRHRYPLECLKQFDTRFGEMIPILVEPALPAY